MKTNFLFLALLLLLSIANAQNYFRSGIFLHHSTGNYIWGPNPDGTSTTTIPIQMHFFNQNHSFISDDSISMEEQWWSPSDNEWYTQHEFFEGNTSFTNIDDYLNNYKIIVIKSCFPSSSIQSIGSADDTLNPSKKSVYNYKWHWRHIIKVMEQHPENFFVIWTNAPLDFYSTTSTEAMLSKQFCKWAKDTLAEGLDQEYGDFPPNVYVFDYFSKLTDENGIQLTQYTYSPGDSHPNGAATDLVAPQFVNEIFSAALNYESFVNVINYQSDNELKIIAYPNPASSLLNISFYTQNNSAKITIFNSIGKKVYFNKIGTIKNFQNNFSISTINLNDGLYFLKIEDENSIKTLKVLINQ